VAGNLFEITIFIDLCQGRRTTIESKLNASMKYQFITRQADKRYWAKTYWGPA